MSSSTPAISSEVAELKDMVKALLLDKKNQSLALAQSLNPAPVKAVNQPPAYQAPIPQTQSVSKTNLESYVKANDAVLRNMKNEGQNLQIQMANLTETLSKFMGSNTASSSGSRTLPSNTITNPKEDLKGITTRSGVAYQGLTIPTTSKVVKQGTEVTKDQVQTPSSKSTAPVQPLVIRSETQTTVFEPVVSAPMPNLKPSIPYPSRHNNERRRDQANEQIEKFYEIFKDMTDFVVVDFEPDPRVPLILERCFLKIGRALIDLHKGKPTLCIGNKAINYTLDQTARYSANYNQMTTNKIDIICEEYSQEVLDFSDVTTSGNPNPYDDLIVSTMCLTLTPFGDNDFILFEEVDAFLGLEDDLNSPKINPFYYDPEGDILLLEAILNSEPLPP
nr:reverse transcriptase domain-containing protein [Tanacetum cinerariifolium]